MLAAQGLVRTAKGPAGGSFVTLPSVDHISSFVQANVALLTETRHVTLEELLEARELVEVPAARLAAARRSQADLDRLRSTVPDDTPRSRAPRSSHTTPNSTPASSRQAATRCSRCRHSRSSPCCRRTSRARRSGAASTPRYTPTTSASSRRSRPPTPTRPPPRCTTTSPSCDRSTNAPGRRHATARRGA